MCAAERSLLFLELGEVQISQEHPTSGTPDEVPLPKTVKVNCFGMMNPKGQWMNPKKDDSSKQQKPIFQKRTGNNKKPHKKIFEQV